MLRLVHSVCQRTNKIQLQPRFLTPVNSLTTKPDCPPPASDFIPVYRFPYIRIFGVINRIKLYQTVLTVGGITVSLALSASNVIGGDVVYTIGSLGLTGCIVLYTFGFLTSKFIGFVYINKDHTEAKVSYLDFWGQRKDTQVAIADIVPFSDMPSAITDDFYLKFSTFSSKDTLRINLKLGQVLDKEGFNKIFIRDI